MDLALSVTEVSHAFTRWGYLTIDEGFAAVESSDNPAAMEVSSSSVHADRIKRAVFEFVQRWQKYFPKGHNGCDLDESVVELMKKRFCNCSDFEPMRANGNLRRWNSKRLRWSGDVRVGNLSWSTAQAFVITETAKVCGMQIELSGVGRVNLDSIDRVIDGAGNTLGQAYLPRYPSDAASETLRQEFDRAETHLTQHLFNLVALHEVAGHSLGLGHDTSQVKAVMDPFIQGELETWQTPDIRELVVRYGTPGDPVEPPTPPVDPDPPQPPTNPDRPCRPRELRQVVRGVLQVAQALSGD